MHRCTIIYLMKRARIFLLAPAMMLVLPFLMSNSPAPTYPDISADDHPYSIRVTKTSTYESSHQLCVNVDNNSDVTFLPTGFSVHKNGLTVQEYPYAFDVSYINFILPNTSSSDLEAYVYSSEAPSWLDDPEATISLMGSYGTLNKTTSTSFICPEPTLEKSEETGDPSFSKFSTNFSWFNFADGSGYSSVYCNNVFSYKDKEYSFFTKTYKNGGTIVTYSNNVTFLKDGESPEVSDFTYVRTDFYDSTFDGSGYRKRNNGSFWASLLAGGGLIVVVIGLIISILLLLGVVVFAIVRVCKNA